MSERKHFFLTEVFPYLNNWVGQKFRSSSRHAIAMVQCSWSETNHSELSRLCKNTISPFLSQILSFDDNPIANIIFQRQSYRKYYLSTTLSDDKHYLSGKDYSAVKMVQYLKLFLDQIVKKIIWWWDGFLYFLRANSAWPDASLEWTTTCRRVIAVITIMIITRSRNRIKIKTKGQKDF